MSTGKKGNKQAAPPAPVVHAPAPVVEVVVSESIPKAEDLQPDLPPVEAAPTYNDNQRRVLFVKLPVKSIVSFHSGSILAQEDPVPIELSTKQLLEIKNVFAASATITTVARSSLPLTEAERLKLLADKAKGISNSSSSSSSLSSSNNNHDNGLPQAEDVTALPRPVVPDSSDSDTVTENRLAVAQLLSIIDKLHGQQCSQMSLDKDYLQEVVDHYLPVARDQTPPPPVAPEPIAAPVDPKAKGSKTPIAHPPPEPLHRDPPPRIPADGLLRVTSLNEQDFLDWYGRFFADAYFYGQRLRLFAGRGLSADVKQLLHRQCCVNTGNGEGLTPLHYACEFNRVDVVDTLVQFGGKSLLVNAPDKHGWTALHSAVHHGSLACVRRLLDLPDIDVNAVNRFGKTPLHIGVSHNRGPIVFLLLSRGAKIDSRDNRGMTLLHEVAFRGHVNLYNELVMDCQQKRKQDYDNLAAMRDDMGHVASYYLDDIRDPEASVAEKELDAAVSLASTAATSRSPSRQSAKVSNAPMSPSNKSKIGKK
jgi:ankyrin repeat protein